MASERLFMLRIRLLVAIVCVVGAVIVGRLVHVQAVDSERFVQRARSQHEATQKLQARRGTITDRNGHELAVSIEVDSAYVDPGSLDDPAATARELARVLDLDRKRLQDRFGTDRSFAWVKRQISPAERARIEASPAASDVAYTRESKRFYPKGRLASHLLGFVGTDGEGLEGIEKDYDDLVRGEGSSLLVLRDGKGGRIPMQVPQPSRTGANIELTLDETIQYAAETSLDQAMRSTGSKKGTIIVIEPSSGEILALANRPTFDPNAFGACAAIARKNVALGDRYEPGSTFKMITAAAAIEEGLQRPGDMIDCGNGSIRVGGRTIHDHGSYDTLSLTDVIAKSSNIGIIRVGLRLGAPKLHDYVRRFGFGTKTGVGLSCEAEGIVHDLSRWSELSTASVSMGQEILVTPIQVLQAFAAVANEGTIVPPRIIRSVLMPDGTRHEPEVLPGHIVLSSRTARTLTTMMEETVLSGTAKAAAVPGYTVAGKTGTAQKIGSDGRYSHTEHVSSFVGFSPSRNPRVAAIVVLDDPRGHYYGGEVAAPPFSQVVAVALERLRVPPDDLTDEGADQESGDARTQPRPLLARVERGRNRSGAAAPALPVAYAMTGRDTAPSAGSGPARANAAAVTVARARRDAHRAPVIAEGVPDLTALALRDAVLLLSERGYLARSAGTGVVISQDPPAGSMAPRGTACRLVLSPAPPLPAEAGPDSAEPGR